MRLLADASAWERAAIFFIVVCTALAKIGKTSPGSGPFAQVRDSEGAGRFN